MNTRLGISPLMLLGSILGTVLACVLVLPLVVLVFSTTLDEVLVATSHPLFSEALWLSLKTTCVSVLLTIITGTPLAWWLASSKSRLARVTAVLVELPIVIPPAVVGVALLQTFGTQGPIGALLEPLGVMIPFTSVAVVLAQIAVASPFFIQASANAFRKVDPDVLLVARTLGASPSSVFLRIALPTALPGLITGASLTWARALGELGATLLFAGNMAGETQTMPLAVLSTLESDIRLAVVFALVLGAVGVLLLVALRLLVPKLGRAANMGDV